MICELAPGHPLDLTDRVAVVGVVDGPEGAARALDDGADAVLVPAEAEVAVVDALLAAGRSEPVLVGLEHLDPADVADLTGLGVDAAVARTTAAVHAGARVLVADDVRTVRRAADVTVAVLLAGGDAK